MTKYSPKTTGKHAEPKPVEFPLAEDEPGEPAPDPVAPLTEAQRLRAALETIYPQLDPASELARIAQEALHPPEEREP